MNLNFLSTDSLRKKRYQKVFPWIKGNVLELGCGLGLTPEFLKNNKSISTYSGVDFNQDNIDSLIIKYPEYHFFYQDLDNIMDIDIEMVDTVLTVAVIEHIYNQKNFLLTATKNLKIGGNLVITTPSNFGNDIIYPIMCQLGLRKGKGVLSDHIVIYNKDRFGVVANDFGLKLEYFEYFEFFCNQLIVFKKVKAI